MNIVMQEGRVRIVEESGRVIVEEQDLAGEWSERRPTYSGIDLLIRYRTQPQKVYQAAELFTHNKEKSQ